MILDAIRAYLADPRRRSLTPRAPRGRMDPGAPRQLQAGSHRTDPLFYARLAVADDYFRRRPIHRGRYQPRPPRPTIAEQRARAYRLALRRNLPSAGPPAGPPA